MVSAAFSVGFGAARTLTGRRWGAMGMATLGMALAAFGGIAGRSAYAQGGGTLEQVRILYGFPAGSAGDSVARRVAEKMGSSSYTKNMGVVENKPGAGGRIALDHLGLDLDLHRPGLRRFAKMHAAIGVGPAIDFRSRQPRQ